MQASAAGGCRGDATTGGCVAVAYRQRRPWGACGVQGGCKPRSDGALSSEAHLRVKSSLTAFGRRPIAVRGVATRTGRERRRTAASRAGHHERGLRLDGLLDQLGSVVGDVLNSVPVRLLVLGTIAYVTVVWLATAHWVLRDMRRRRDDPVSPYVAALAIVLASPILLPIVAFTYLILRPRETLAEARERELTERLDALGADLLLSCPECRRPVEEDWLTCPACRTRLARRCLGCGRSMGLDWSLCGFCGAEFGRPVIARRVPATVRRSLPQRRPVSVEVPAAVSARHEDRVGNDDRAELDRRTRGGLERRERATEPRREVFEPGR